MSNHPYDDWADIYDRVFADLDHDVPFYVQQALASGGPVLELGSGTGRVALALAAASIEVHGVDVSPRMVQRAREKAEAAGLANACRFQQGDMRTVRLGLRFPLVIMPFRSFQNMLSVDDQRAALATVDAHLEAGGCLAFDVFAPDPRMLATDDPAPFHVRDVRQPDTGHTWLVSGQNRWDHQAQTNHVRVVVEEVAPDGTVLQRLHRSLTVRYTHRYEMEHLLKLSGFTVDALYGDFQGGPVTSDSDDLVWLARA